MEFESKPSSSHLAQMNLYFDIKKVKNCGLIFPGTNNNKIYRLDKIGLNLHVLFFDIQAKTHYEFKNKSYLFMLPNWHYNMSISFLGYKRPSFLIL